MEAVAGAAPVGQPLTNGDSIAAEVATLGVDAATVAGPQKAEMAASAEQSGDARVVVVAVDSGPFCMAAFQSAAKMLDKATNHYHIVHVRPAPGMPKRPCTQLRVQSILRLHLLFLAPVLSMVRL